MTRAIPLCLAACLASQAGAADRPRTPDEVRALLANAEIVGPSGQPELIVPLGVPGWAGDLGVTGVARHYKGVCGPDGAVATVELLLEHAERDLLGSRARYLAQYTRGTSTKFVINYDAANTDLVNDYLPDFIDAAVNTDVAFANRATITVDLTVEPITSGAIGTASSTRYNVPWSAYVEALRTHGAREIAVFAEHLPDSSLPVRFGFPPTGTSSVTSIRITDAQLRAVFGDNAVPPATSVGITLDSESPWEFQGCDNHPEFWELSLIDVAVHEITHALGFTSSIWRDGDNPLNQIQGLDVARFLMDQAAPPGFPGGMPLNNTSFTTFPRHGEGAMASAETQHVYASIPEGFFFTLLEQGDGDMQPSHLMYVSGWGDKLGIMDPVLNHGRSRCDEGFWTVHDLRPLHDMGWYPVAHRLDDDCNQNGIPDIGDIITGLFPDRDGDFLLDVCESFAGDKDLADIPTFAGLTLSRWSAPNLSTLDGFDPGNHTLVFRGATDDASHSHGSHADEVHRLSGFLVVPEDNEYAFRASHSEAAMLRIADRTLFSLPDSRSIERSGSSTRIAAQHFINLEAGAHEFELTVIMNSTGDSVRVLADSFSLGTGYAALTQSDVLGRLGDFPDCDGNGVDDRFDPDSDNDGIPDACETPPCNAADLAEPYGVLDLADVTAFVGAFQAGDPAADLDQNGIHDLDDIVGFGQTLLSGCP